MGVDQTYDLATPSFDGRSGMRLRRLVVQRQFALTIVAGLLFAFFSIFAEHFFTLDNVYDIARASAFLIIVGVPLTYLFIAGELDLSVGSAFAFCSVCMALLVAEHGISPWLAALVTILIGAAIGAINGFVTTEVGVPSFIVTLGTLSLLRGAALVITAGYPILYPDELRSSFLDAAGGKVAGVPALALWACGVFVVGALVLKYTRFGYHVYATGGNARAARAAGIRSQRIKLECFILTGAAVGLIGALQGGWLRTGDPTTGNGFELQVIAAVIIGGVALTGGEGSVYGTFLGAAIVGMLANGIVLLGVQGNWNQIFIGLIIICVAGLEVGVRRRHEVIAWLQRRRPSRA